MEQSTEHALDLAEHFIWHYANKNLNVSHILWSHFPAHPHNTRASLSLSILLTPLCRALLSFMPLPQQMTEWWHSSCYSNRQLQTHNRHRRWIFQDLRGLSWLYTVWYLAWFCWHRHIVEDNLCSGVEIGGLRTQSDMIARECSSEQTQPVIKFWHWNSECDRCYDSRLKSTNRRTAQNSWDSSKHDRSHDASNKTQSKSRHIAWDDPNKNTPTDCMIMCSSCLLKRWR